MILDSWTGMTWGRFVRNKPNPPIADCGRSRSGTGGSCKTNPISGLAGWDAARRHEGRGANVRNEAKLGQAGASGASGDGAWGSPSCDNASLPGVVPATKPISAVVAGASPHYSNIPSFQHFHRCPLCETNPIHLAVPGGRRPGGTWDQGQMRKTNPISGAARGVRGVGAIVRNKPNWPPATPEPAGPIVRNKANCGGSFKSEVSSAELARPGGQVSRSSCFKIYTSSFPRVARWWGS
jgi:hypothetical protein